MLKGEHSIYNLLKPADF